MSAFDLLLENNGTYAAEFEGGGISKVPRLHVAVVTCMDTRIDPLHIFGVEIGDIHVIRNAFGAVTEDIVRSLVLSHHLLAVDEVVLMRHTDCGGIGLDESDVKRQIAARSAAAYWHPLLGFGDTAAAVRNDVATVSGESALSSLHSVRGCIYDVASGTVTTVDA